MVASALVLVPARGRGPLRAAWLGACIAWGLCGPVIGQGQGQVPPVAPLSSAPAAPAASAPAASVQGLWQVLQARTEPVLDARLARLDFGADGRLTGHTSCNLLQARYTLSGDRLQVSAVALSRQACRPLLLEQEDRILTALELASTARVRGDGLLELRDAEGRGVLRAVRPAP